MGFTRRTFLGLATGAIATAANLSLGRTALAAVAPDSLQDEIAAIADRALGEVATPGVQIALWRDGKPLSSFARGRANLETGTGTTIGSVFRIGSLTKQFTAALVALLAEQGMLELDAPASRYLPFLRKQPVFSVAELIHHTAGLHADEQAAPLSGEVTQSRVAEAIAAQNNLFDFPPGTAWQYSNANYHVLGAIIEQVTGQTLAEAADTRLFSRLALSHTAFDNAADIVPGRVAGYAFGDGDPPVLQNAPCIDIVQAGGAGAMRSTADDLCRWHAELFDGRVVNGSSLQAMLAPARLRDGRMASAQRARKEDAMMGQTEYGFGLLLDRATRDGSLIVQHNGFIDGFSAYLATHVPSRLTIACLCNADPNPGLPFRALRRATFASILPPA